MTQSPEQAANKKKTKTRNDSAVLMLTITGLTVVVVAGGLDGPTGVLVAGAGVLLTLASVVIAIAGRFVPDRRQ